MATGLYSGVSGLAIGVGLNKGVTGLWSGASGLITGWGATAFNPLSLFASGEQGAWYDPSDLSTMFQDTAGTTPVTATGQTVGLLLDKSQGLVLGPELGTGILNSTSGWSFVGAAVVSGGVLAFTTPPSTTASATYNPILTSGKRYRVTVVLTGSGIVNVRAGSGGDQVALTAPGTFTFYIAAAGGTPTQLVFNSAVSSVNNYVGNVTSISVKELPGNHATQATAASRPIYQVDGNGKAYLLFDGTDDFLLTGTITPGIDKAQVFTGVRKLSDAGDQALLETSAGASFNNGAISLFAPVSGGANYNYGSRGTTFRGTTAATFTAPITNVVTGTSDISGDIAAIRVNGVQASPNTGDQGTGNYLAYPLYIGRRGGTSLPFNGRIYQMIVRFGANLSAATITQTENYTAGKTGFFAPQITGVPTIV